MLKFCIGMVVVSGVVASLGACSSPTRQAPIEDRSSSVGTKAAPVASAITSAANSAPPPLITASTGNTYTVKAGDTLYSVALAHGRDYRDLAQWNQLSDPGLIKVGQVLQVAAPDTTPAAVQTTPLKLTESVEAKPLGAAGAKPNEVKNAGEGKALGTAPVSTTPTSATPVPTTASMPVAQTAATALQWEWPVPGEITEKFDETRNKGIDLAGKTGDPVLAAEAGKVVYVGSGLRGYGNLVIVKHNDDFISAYAHNSKLLVQLNDVVKRGQKIAELGNSDADHAKLHFEIRYQGKPADPLKYLPARK